MNTGRKFHCCFIQRAVRAAVLFLLVNGSAFSDELEDLIRSSNDYWQQQVNPVQDCGWQNSVYQRGNLAAYGLLGDENYLDYAVQFAADICQWQLAPPKKSSLSINTEPDAQAIGSTYLDLYGSRQIPGADISFLMQSLNDRLTSPLDDPEWILQGGSPSGASPDGRPEWTFQDWFYMAGPVMAKAGKLCANEYPPEVCEPVSSNNNPYWNKLFELYSHMKSEQFISTKAETEQGQGLMARVEETGCGSALPRVWQDSVLFWHDINKKDECEKIWSRGTGWVLAAYPEILAEIPTHYFSWVYPENQYAYHLSVSANRSEPGNPAENTLDQDVETRWACLNQNGLENCSAIYELDEPTELNAVFIAFYRGDQRYAFFNLEGSRDQACSASPDSADWFPVYVNGMSSGSTTETEYYAFSRTTLKCLRFVGLGNSENDWNSILEFDVSNDAEGGEQAYAVRDVLAGDFRLLAETVIHLQRQSDGFWNPALFDTIADNPTASEGAETSGTALITYALAKGVNMGLLSRPRYLPVILKAWNGLQTKALITDDEQGPVLGYVQGVAQQPPEAPLTAYDTVDGSHPDRQYALGAFLLAATEVARLEQLPIVSAVASSAEEGNPAAYAIDGDLLTRWAGQGVDDESGWIGFVLPELTDNISRIDIAWYRGDQRQAMFDLEYSDSGTCMASRFDLDFKPIEGAVGLQSSGNSLLQESFEFAPIKAKCIRYQGRGNSENDWNSITEFEIYTTLQSSSGMPLAIAPEMVRANRWQEPNVPANVVDDDAASRWSCENQSGEDDCRLWLDLGEIRRIGQLEIAFYNGSVRTESFDIEVTSDAQCLTSSDDGIWQLYTQRDGNSADDVETIALDGVSARCIRFVGHGNSANDWNAINALRVYPLESD
ncbi:MAG: glycoside hydrolase family 88 protein [Gammaproteobacteria bacterium]|nr:glycoside hydrolase family 88 protein [Gammaproteobacteria bacterium]